MSPKQKKSTEKGPRHKRNLHKQSPEHKELTQTVPRHKKYTNNPTHANTLAQTVSRTGGSMQKLPKQNKSTERWPRPTAQTKKESTQAGSRQIKNLHREPRAQGIYTNKAQTKKTPHKHA